MGDKRQARDKINCAIDVLLPSDHSRTQVEKSFVNDIDILAKSKLKAAELRTLARIVELVKKIIDERTNSD